MTARELSAQERAVVERFEQAPDALAEVLTTEQRTRIAQAGDHEPMVCDCDAYAPDDGWPDDLICDGLFETFRVVAHMVAEAADAREAEVRARVEAVLREPGNAWWHVGGTRCTPTRAIRAALAPADNDGEA